MLIGGIGTDIVEIDRLKRVVERQGTRFLKRVFTEDEVAFCFGRKDPYPCLAARFAAKEAVFKSLGTGLAGCRWTDVEVVRNGTAAPEIILGGSTRLIAERAGFTRIMISISHGRSTAVAFALAIKGGK
ncbi:MAG: holo-ACP synthase [Peptococcaceae bacterium]|nr:holo-ACP synthase [Peptococcaceae bacterium]